MLRLNDPMPNPFDTANPITGSVWRWLGLGVDILSGGPVVLGMFPTVEAAQSYDRRDAAGVVLPQAQRAKPLDQRQVECRGAAFLALVGQDYPGATLGERLTAAVYAAVRAAVPEFADAEDVGV